MALRRPYPSSSTTSSETHHVDAALGERWALCAGSACPWNFPAGARGVRRPLLLISTACRDHDGGILTPGVQRPLLMSESARRGLGASAQTAGPLAVGKVKSTHPGRALRSRMPIPPGAPRFRSLGLRTAGVLEMPNSVPSAPSSQSKGEQALPL